MPHTLRSQIGIYALNSEMNYYNSNCPAYSTREKYNLLRELSNNLLEKMYQRNCYSVRKTYASYQNSK